MQNKAKDSSVAERFIRNVKSKIYKYITVVYEIVHIKKLDEVVDKYNKTYYRIIKMKAANVQLGTDID